MALRQGFILHQYPTLHYDESGNPFYARIPEEELALLEGSHWPVVNGHLVDEEGNWDSEGELEREAVGTAFDLKIKAGYLHAANVSITANEEEWQGNEYSTVYSAYHEELDPPYPYTDTEGRIGRPGQVYLISEHHRDIQPINLALVDRGRFGSNVAVRERNNKFLVANSAVEFKEKPMATLKEKPAFPPDPNKKKEEIVTANNTEESTTPAPDPAPAVDQAALVQSITQEVLKEGGAIAQFFSEQISKINDAVTGAEAKIGELVANAAATIPAKEEEKPTPAPEEDKPLTANAVEEIFNKCLKKADLSTPHTVTANAGDKPLSFAEQIEANSQL